MEIAHSHSEDFSENFFALNMTNDKNNNNNFNNEEYDKGFRLSNSLNNITIEEEIIEESKIDPIVLRRRKMLMAAEKRLTQSRLTQSDDSLC